MTPNWDRFSFVALRDGYPEAVALTRRNLWIYRVAARDRKLLHGSRDPYRRKWIQGVLDCRAVLRALVTVWYRWRVDDDHPGGAWDLNHLEPGPAQGRSHPRSQHPVHDKLWKGGKWLARDGVLLIRDEAGTRLPGRLTVIDRPMS